MPFGEYPYAVDDKGRVIVPPPFREFVEDGMIITRGMEKCLYVFPMTGVVAGRQAIRRTADDRP